MNLTNDEIMSLRQCPAHGSGMPAPGYRISYAKKRLVDEKLVLPTFYYDKGRDESFFTWQRSAWGERTLKEIADNEGQK